MTSIETKYNEFLNSNSVSGLLSPNKSLEGIINDLLNVKYAKEKIKIKYLIKLNRIITKLKFIKKYRFNGKTDTSYNFKKNLALNDMLKLIEENEDYIKQLDEIISFINYDEIILLIGFLEQEFDNNYNYLKEIISFINRTKNMSSLDAQGEYNNPYINTRYDVKSFFDKKIEELKGKRKTKK